MHEAPRIADPLRILVTVVLVSLLLISCFWVLRPFLPGVLWGVMIVVSSWPLMLRLQEALGGRRIAATVLMTVGLVVVIVVPLLLAIFTLIDNGGELIDWVSSLQQGAQAQPPQWLRELPYVGERIALEWQRLLGAGGLGARLSEHGREITAWMFAQAGSVGAVLLHFAITMTTTVLLYLRGELAALFIRRFALRLAGERAHALVELAGQAIRAVALGIVVTALFQSLLGGLGLLLTGVPFVSVLTSLMLMLCVAQIGPMPVLLPAVIWLFWQGDTWQGVVLGVVAVLAVTLDGVLRPILIQRGAHLPLVLILIGVIGGLIGFGLVGLFLGPVILALSYTLIHAWIDDQVPARIERDAMPPPV